MPRKTFSGFARERKSLGNKSLAKENKRKIFCCQTFEGKRTAHAEKPYTFEYSKKPARTPKMVNRADRTAMNHWNTFNAGVAGFKIQFHGTTPKIKQFIMRAARQRGMTVKPSVEDKLTVFFRSKIR